MSFQFTDQNFKSEAIEASKAKPVLVDFFAAWCGPCKMQAPVIDELSAEMGDKAVIGKLDTETNQLTAGEYGVMSIPTLLVLKDGEVKETMVGLQSKDYLTQVLNKYM